MKMPGEMFNPKINVNRKRYGILWSRVLMALVMLTVLTLVFAAYFRPDFLIDLSIFSQLCS
jgi:hypothetical protein